MSVSGLLQMCRKRFLRLSGNTARFIKRRSLSFLRSQSSIIFFNGRKFIVVTDHKPLISLFSPNKATPALATNRLARWALTLSQYDYLIEYRQLTKHGNADALSRLPSGSDPAFYKKEGGENMDSIFTIKTTSRQIRPTDARVVAKESAKDPVVSAVMEYCKEGWPNNKHRRVSKESSMSSFKQRKDSLSCESGCLFYGSRLVIPLKLQSSVLQILHQGHFGMQRMKQLSRTAVYWPGLDAQIMDTCRSCHACMEHQNNPPQALIHPWMMPEKCWSRVHIDQAVNFMGHTWLVLVDAYSKYPIVHATSSTSSKATIQLLEEDFAHFGFPHTIVSDNATSFTSEEFQEWCSEREITHLSGASELLNGRQIRTKIDVLVPSHLHIAQGMQIDNAYKSGKKSPATISKVLHEYKVGRPVYVSHYGHQIDKTPRWVPAIVSNRLGTRHLLVKVLPQGSV